MFLGFPPRSSALPWPWDSSCHREDTCWVLRHDSSVHSPPHLATAPAGEQAGITGIPEAPEPKTWVSPSQGVSGPCMHCLLPGKAVKRTVAAICCDTHQMHLSCYLKEPESPVSGLTFFVQLPSPEWPAPGSYSPRPLRRPLTQPLATEPLATGPLPSRLGLVARPWG